MNDLFCLIREMNTSERRQFKIFCTTQGKQETKKYLQLFDAYSKIASKSERLTDAADVAIMNQIGGPKEVYLVLKNYLSEALLDFLRYHHRDSSRVISLYNQLLDAKILEEKGLLDWCLRKLERVKKEAVQFELFSLAEEAVSRTVQILVRKRNIEQEKLVEYFGEMNNFLSAEMVINWYRHQTFKVNWQFESLGIVTNSARLEAIAQLESTIKEYIAIAPPTTFLAKREYLNTQAMLQILKANPQGAYHAFQDLVAHWDAHPHFKERMSLSYLVSLGNLLGQCLASNLFEEARKVIERMELVSCSKPEEKAFKIVNLEFNNFLLMLNFDRLEDALVLGHQIDNKIKTFERYIQHAYKITHAFNMVILYVLLENFKMAQERLAFTLQMSKNEPRRDLQISLGMLDLIVRYELGETKIIETTYQTITKRMRTANFENTFEQKTVRMVYNLVQTIDARSKQQIFKKFVKTLEEWRALPDFKKPRSFEIIEFWAIARADRISTRQAFQRFIKSQKPKF